MHAFAREHDRAPTSIDWRQSTIEHPGAGAVSKIFGSWSAGLIAAGLEPHQITWDRKQIIAALRAWTKLHDRPPRKSEWETRDPTHPRATDDQDGAQPFWQLASSAPRSQTRPYESRRYTVGAASLVTHCRLLRPGRPSSTVL